MKLSVWCFADEKTFSNARKCKWLISTKFWNRPQIAVKMLVHHNVRQMKTTSHLEVLTLQISHCRDRSSFNRSCHVIINVFVVLKYCWRPHRLLLTRPATFKHTRLAVCIRESSDEQCVWCVIRTIVYKGDFLRKWHSIRQSGKQRKFIEDSLPLKCSIKNQGGIPKGCSVLCMPPLSFDLGD